MRERWQRLRAAVEDRLGKVAWIEHHRRAWVRASGLRFTRWAAAMALFGYLALFPLLVLAFIVFGIVLSRTPALRESVESFLAEALPLLFDPQGDLAPVDIEQVASATLSAGVVAVVGLLYAGLGWVDATVEGVRRMQGAMRRPHHFLLLKAQDVVTLLVVGAVLLTAIIGAVVVETLGTEALDQLPWSHSRSSLQLAAAVLLAALLMLVLVALYAGAWWQRGTRRWRTVVMAGFLASLTLVLMLRLSFLLVGRTLGNPVYGTLALAAALLLFLYFASAVVLYFACWIAVVEGAPETEEEAAYRDRRLAGDITLPTVSASRRPDADAAGASPPA